MTLKRSDKQYLDVESFEEYEFTPCIAYEMFIRNNRVQEILIKSMVNTPNHLKGYNQLDKEIKDEEKELHNKYGVLEDFYTKYHFFDESNKILEEYFKDFNNHVGEIKKIEFNDIDGSKHSRFKEYDGFYRQTVIETGSDTPHYKKHIISPKFKRPILFLNLIDNDASIYIDLSLPENELVAYIKHLKKTYQKYIIVTPYDNFIGKISNSSNKKALPKGSVMANIFYVYDCLKLGYTKRKIQNEVYNYYADQGIETRTLDYKTLKKYHDIAIDYIDNKRYLELITGKKLEELEELEIRNFKN